MAHGVKISVSGHSDDITQQYGDMVGGFLFCFVFTMEYMANTDFHCHDEFFPSAKFQNGYVDYKMSLEPPST